jgi:hypothetical protein
LTETGCPVTELAREAATLIAAAEAGGAEELELGLHTPERVALEQASARIAERRTAIERRAARTRARSLEGGLFQVMLARSEAEYLSHLADETRSAEAEQTKGRIDGLLLSVLRLLEELSGTPAETLGAQYYMGDPDAAPGVVHEP